MRTPNRRVLLASLVGSAIEWFDFFLFGSATPLVFNRLFFPATDPLVSLLLMFQPQVRFLSPKTDKPALTWSPRDKRMEDSHHASLESQP